MKKKRLNVWKTYDNISIGCIEEEQPIALKLI